MSKSRRSAQSTASAPGVKDGLAQGAAPRRAYGNAFLQDRIAQRQEAQPLDAGMRAAAEASLGRSFADVRVHQGPQAEALTLDMGAAAYARGRDVFLGPDVDNAPGFVLAHELAHVAQQAGGTPGAPQGGGSSPEQEADQAAGAILAGQPTAVHAVGGPRVQPFAPEHHQQASVQGLEESYTPAEIGAVYQSNWERDFAQAAPAISDVALAWKSLRMSAADNGGVPSAKDSAEFRARVKAVFKMGIFESTSESMGGSHYWEHLDNPGSDYDGEYGTRTTDQHGVRRGPDPANHWKGSGSGLSAYIQDARAYAKDQIVDAVDALRESHELPTLGQGIDNWAGATKKPRHYDRDEIRGEARDGYHDDDVPAPAVSTQVVAQETARMVETPAEPQAGGDLSTDPAWHAVSHHMGRAMHVVEDFFAHSNWVELALAWKGNAQSGGELKMEESQVATGTFEMADKTHALGHKLASLAEALLENHDLVLQAYGRGGQAPASPGKDQAIGGITEWMKDRSITLVGEFLDLLNVTEAVDKAVAGGDAGYADIVCDPTFLRELMEKGERMEKHGHDSTSQHGHGRIAKDSEEAGPDFAIARQLAAAADRMVFGNLRDIMQMKDPDAARSWLLEQLGVVDRIIEAPSAEHPLIDLVPDQIS